MASSFYSLESAIDKFFNSQTTVTRQECNNLAVSLAGELVNLVPIQGAFSYTLIVGAEQSKIVQFRAQKSLLDIEALKFARAIYGDFVAACTYEGLIGQLSPLAVYLIERFPGTTYIEARCRHGLSVEASPEATLRQSNTVIDFARFFGASWSHKQHSPTTAIESVHKNYRQKLELLSQTLPSRFTNMLVEAREELQLLFEPTYPMVLTHDDLCEMNIIVNPDTGHISGVVDWAEAEILPFGVSLWGFENITGFMDSQGWHYYNNHRKLLRLLWQTFEKTVGELSDADKYAIQVARTIGFFLRYGFVWEDGVRERPVKEQDSSLRYLDAFCLADG